MRHVRVEHQGRPVDGILEGGRVRLGEEGIGLDDVERWLSPVTPGKIIATHLTYRSRAEEYRMARLPQTPSYFMKPPSSLSAHGEAVSRPPGEERRFRSSRGPWQGERNVSVAGRGFRSSQCDDGHERNEIVPRNLPLASRRPVRMALSCPKFRLRSTPTTSGCSRQRASMTAQVRSGEPSLTSSNS